MRVLLGIGLLALAGCAMGPKQRAAADREAAVSHEKLEDALAGLTPDKPASCMPQTRSSQIKAFGPTILYQVSKGLVYRSNTTGGCDSVARGDILVTRTTIGQVCQGDIATTVDPVSRMQSGSCGFGPFVAYRKK